MRQNDLVETQRGECDGERVMSIFSPLAFLCGVALRWFMSVVLKRLCSQRDVVGYCELSFNVCIDRGMSCWRMIDSMGLWSVLCLEVMRFTSLHV